MRRFLLLAALAVFAAGCSKGSFNSHSSAAASNVFRYPIPNKPTTMDPGKVEDGDTIDLLQQVYEGLVGWSEDNKVAPQLAEKWDVINGGKSYIFHLRTDAKFSNGRPVTAADFKWCIERNCQPALHSQTGKEYMSDIVGVMDVVNGTRKDILGLTAIDDHTLKIDIDKPRPYFLGKLTYPVAFVFAKEAVKDPSKEISDISEMVGTGGYKFQSVNVDQAVTLVANPLYYLGEPKVAEIDRQYVGDAATRLAMFKTGEADLVPLEREDAVSVQSDPNLKEQLHFFPRAAIWYVGINCDVVPVLKQPLVRRAIAMAINKDNIIQNVLSGINDRADCILPPGVFGHRDQGVKTVSYDPEGAKKLLAQAGYPNGTGMPQLTIWFRNNRPDIKIVAEAVGQDLEKNLGLNVDFKGVEWGQYLSVYDKKQIPFCHMRWAADYLDAQNFLSNLLASYGAENNLNYHNPQFDALCSKADVSQDPNERLRLYAQAEDIALQDACMIPVYFQKDAELISPRVKGLRNSLFGHLPHTKVYLQ